MKIEGWVIIAKSRENDDTRVFHTDRQHIKRACLLVKLVDKTAKIVPATLTIEDKP